MQAFQFFHQTAAIATPIVQTVPPVSGLKPILTSLVYTAGTTAHDLVFMRSLNRVKTTAAAAAAATTLVLDSVTFAGQTIAANDYVVVQHSDGTYSHYLVSALAVLTITINTLSKAVVSGAPVWIMGAPAETYHSTLKSIASTRQDFSDYLAGIAQGGFDDGTSYSRSGLGDPVMIYSSNATAAGTLNRGSVYYGG